MNPTLNHLPILVWTHKFKILAVASSFAILTALVCAFLPAIYEGTSVIAVQIRNYQKNDVIAQATIPVTRIEQMLNSHAQILQSDEVLRRSVRAFGPANLYPDMLAELAEPHRNLQSRLRGIVSSALEAPIVERMGGPIGDMRDAALRALQPLPSGSNEAMARSPEDEALKRVSEALTVRLEPNTTLVRVSFRHRDPIIAAQFVSVLVKTFIDRSLELDSDSGVVQFFKRRDTHYESELQQAITDLSNFSIKSNAYSIIEQRKLTLRRMNELLANLTATRGTIVDKENQIQALDKELARIRPRALESNQVGGNGGNGTIARGRVEDQPFASDPPLLMVRVYQETVQSGVRLRSELAGLRALADQQGAEVTKVSDELKKLSSIQSEFERLTRNVDLARARVKLYATKLNDQQLEADLNSNRFSNLQVVQSAAVPKDPVFPKPALLIPLGFLVGGMLGLAFAVTSDAKRKQAAERRYGSAALQGYR